MSTFNKALNKIEEKAENETTGGSWEAINSNTSDESYETANSDAIDENKAMVEMENITLPTLQIDGNEHVLENERLNDECWDTPPHFGNTTWNFLFPVVASTIYIAHFAVDIALAFRYRSEGDFSSFLITLFYAFLPFFIVNPILYACTGRRKFTSVLKFVFTFQQLGFFIQCFYFTVKTSKYRENTESENYKKNYFKMYKVRKTSCNIDALEAATKFLTQGILQLYLFYKWDNLNDISFKGVLQITSTILSLVHLFWILGSISLEKQILLAVFGIILYLADVISDLYLSADYLREEQYLYAFLTLSFVLAASIITTNRSRRREEELPMNSLKNVLICVPIVIFNLEPVFAAIKSIHFRLKMIKNYTNSSECENYNGNRKKHKAWATDLKFFETILEAAPQLTLQVSILLLSTLKGYELNFKAMISIVTSFIGFGAGILSRYNAFLDVYGRDKMSKLGSVLIFFWYFPIIAFRILAIAMMVSISPLSMVKFIGVHWIILFLYWFYDWWRVFGLERIILSIWSSLTYIFIPDPLESKIKIAVFSSILGIENLCLVLYVIFFASFEELSFSESYKCNIRSFYHILGAITLTCGVVGTIFMLLFVFVLKIHVSDKELRQNRVSNT